MSKSTIASREGAAGAVLTILDRKEAELRDELNRIAHVRAILVGDEEPKADPPISAITGRPYSLNPPLKRRGRPKGPKTSKRAKP